MLKLAIKIVKTTEKHKKKIQKLFLGKTHLAQNFFGQSFFALTVQPVYIEHMVSAYFSHFKGFILYLLSLRYPFNFYFSSLYYLSYNSAF